MADDSTPRPVEAEAPEVAAPPGRRGARWIRWLRLPLLAVILFIVMAWTGCAERLVYYPTRDTPPPPPGAEEVWFEASDGVRLHAWFLPARRGAESATGSVLVAHGNAGNIGNHVDFVSFLPAAGFNVFIFDYRGYGKSEPGTLRREYLLRDTEAALEALLARDDVDPERIAVYAQSLGGVFGLHVMAKRPEVKAAVIVSAFTRWRDIAASVLGGGETPGPISRFFAAMLMPDGLDPIDALKEITDRPILLIHGTDDEIVPFANAERLADAGGENVRLRPARHADHNSIRYLDAEFDVSIIEFYRSVFGDGG